MKFHTRNEGDKVQVETDGERERVCERESKKERVMVCHFKITGSIVSGILYY